MATQLANGDRDRLNEVFGSFIDETIGIVARQTRDTVSFAVGSPAREALDLVGAYDLAATVIDFWAENGLEHERCGEMIERIGLANFLEGIGVDVDPNMIAHPRTSSYVRLDDWDQEAQKWIERKKQAVV